MMTKEQEKFINEIAAQFEAINLTVFIMAYDSEGIAISGYGCPACAAQIALSELPRNLMEGYIKHIHAIEVSNKELPPRLSNMKES